MPHVAEADIRSFAIKTLSACGLAGPDAEAITDGLILATKRGVTTHGVFRLPQYCQSVEAGKINGRPDVQVLQRRGVTALVNADGGYGFRPGIMAMDIAIEIARQHGVGAVGVRNSHHFGAAAIYSERAALAGLIGLTTTTTRANIAPTGAIGPVVGNNPISIAVPRRPPNRPMILDMALSQVAMGRVRVAAANGEEIPPGWGFDSKGRPTTDPNAILANGILAAVGGHKGYGLSVMTEVLAGVLTGSPFALDSNNHDHPRGGVGHFFLAIAPDFMRDIDAFYADVEKLVGQVKSSPMAEGSTGIFLPGELEDMKSAEADRDGLAVSAELVGQLEELARKTGIPVPAWKN
jgi:LDH2 family malate/lactate/ureidoglycolate dehydrogenase